MGNLFWKLAVINWKCITYENLTSYYFDLLFFMVTSVKNVWGKSVKYLEAVKYCGSNTLTLYLFSTICKVLLHSVKYQNLN